MKVTSLAHGKAFRPIYINLSLDTAEEVAAFYAHFNVAASCDLLQKYGIHSSVIRRAIVDANGGPVDYTKVHGKLCDLYTQYGAAPSNE